MMSRLKLAGVIGFPITHSRSPRLHGHWLSVNGIDGHYVPLQIAPSDFAACLPMLPRMGFAGANVTIPHKETVLSLADSVTPLARRIGAANTLVFGENGIEADNTDAHGFTWNILDHVPGWRPEKAALLGAGGASRAVIVALQEMGVRELRLANRNPERARALATELGPGIVCVPWSCRDDMLEGCDILVNSTSLGMTGQPALEIRLDALPVTAIVNDLVYAPLETALLACARKRGNIAVDGLGMLLHQAVPGFTRWFGVVPTVDAQLRKCVMQP